MTSKPSCRFLNSVHVTNGPMLFPTLIHDLPRAIVIDPILSSLSGTSGYADSILDWLSGPSVEAVKPVLESLVRAVVAYLDANYMALSLGKTQIFWVSLGPCSPCVTICDFPVTQVDTIKVLGLKFHRSQKPDPKIGALVSGVATIAGIARRPRLYLRFSSTLEVVRSLLVGKVGYRAAATNFPHFKRGDPSELNFTKLQAHINDVARAAYGTDIAGPPPPIIDLLASTGILLVSHPMKLGCPSMLHYPQVFGGSGSYFCDLIAISDHF